jgi:hypothetical protein
MNRNLVGSIYGRQLLRNFNYTKKISQISMYYVETRADNSGYANHRVTCLVVMGSMFVNGSELNDPCFDIVHRNLGYFFSIIKISQ